MKRLLRSPGFLLVLAIGAFAGGWFLRSQSPSRQATHGSVAETKDSAPSSPARSTPLAASTHLPRPKTMEVSPSEEESGPSVTIVSDRPRFVAEPSTAQRKVGENDPQLRMVAGSVRDYRIAFRQNPVGTNAEITRLLSGKNSRGVRYLPSSAHLNDKGELTDRWNQPVFFHQISGAIMEIRSAGPDHVMWNADDEVLR